MKAKPKAFQWAMKTPLAPVECPFCKQRFSCGIEFKVHTRPKVWKVVKMAKKEVGDNEV